MFLFFWVLLGFTAPTHMIKLKYCILESIEFFVSNHNSLQLGKYALFLNNHLSNDTSFRSSLAFLCILFYVFVALSCIPALQTKCYWVTFWWMIVIDQLPSLLQQGLHTIFHSSYIQTLLCIHSWLSFVVLLPDHCHNNLTPG